MSLVREIVQWIGSFAVQQTILSLVLVTGLMIAVEERRVSVFAFLGQYALLFLLLVGRVYQPVAALKGAIGVPISMILYISASHVERQLREVRAACKAEGTEAPTGWGRALRERIRRARVGTAFEERNAAFPVMKVSLTGMSSSFRMLVVALGAAGAYGLWQAYPITLLSPRIGLACYWLVATGLLLAATSQDPLRVGIGLLTLLNGFEIAYYTLNTSLMLVGLMGAGEILIALVAASAAERWRVGVDVLGKR